ncbi:hypothetical protein [Sorangium sp. So ce145]|uniref:hypothetical protein n=1 Tax=Sorangium sp. So ce145 TaxID=3133285 RepID=UPI003F6279CC
MSASVESVVLCEGYHDRAFWAGWLVERLGWTDARPRRENGTYDIARDPFGKPVTRGDFAYRTPLGRFLRVRPCHGDSQVLAVMKTRLRERTTNGLRRLAVNLDVDTDAAETNGAPQREAALRDAVERIVAQEDPRWSRTPDGDLCLDGGATLVSLVLWSASDPPTPELPPQQTLERLVCAALRAAYPDRAAAVGVWLASRRDPPPATPKEHAWSHMAGWYAAHNCDDFFQAVWRTPAVAAELEARLRASGALRAAAALDS